MLYKNINRFFSFVAEGYKPKLQLKQSERPFKTIFKKFHHLTFYTFNGYQSSKFYQHFFDFNISHYEGPETGLKDKTIYILNNGNMILELISPINNNKNLFSFLKNHGDTLKSCTIEIDNIEDLITNLKNNNTKFKQKIYKNEYGKVKEIEVPIFNYISHKFIEKSDYKGGFLPQYECKLKDDKNDYIKLDHIGFPQNENEMNKVCDFYFNNFNFHHFWSIDENIAHSDVSALNSTVVSDFDENIKFPIFEPVQKKKKSQILEFLEYNNGPGAQHIAIQTEDIIKTVNNLQNRGLEFLDVPDSYYDLVSEKLYQNNMRISEDLDVLKKNKILLDFDENGYLLQIFTKPVISKPTLFYEFIQRRNNNGFGVGNFRRLFLSIENEQNKRGNLI